MKGSPPSHARRGRRAGFALTRILARNLAWVATAAVAAGLGGTTLWMKEEARIERHRIEALRSRVGDLESRRDELRKRIAARAAVREEARERELVRQRDRWRELHATSLDALARAVDELERERGPGPERGRDPGSAGEGDTEATPSFEGLEGGNREVRNDA